MGPQPPRSDCDLGYAGTETDVATEASTAASGAARTPRRSATIYDIARLADVSHQSVSRYLRGLPMRDSTRERIEKALTEVEYKPNLTARALTTGRSHRIGALTHEIDQVGPSQIVQGASQAARAAGYLLDIVSLDMTDPAAVEEAVALLRQHDLAGILALSSTDEMRRAFEHASFDVPTVIVTESDDPDDDDLLSFAIPALIDHLADLGHERFLHVAGPDAWAAARNRRLAYERAVTARGLTSVGTLMGDWSAKSGHDAIASLPDARTATAIVAANDQMALGALRALAERGIRVPDDVSVTGVDDIPEAAYFTPPLTTVRIDFRTQGRDAVHELLAEVDGVERERATTMKSGLILRSSCGPAPRLLGA
ncbi:substrate-binding domain-containing protein [Microbacter sp. GSS18]|nr:substrate-binding domain-containing protein [Microbacter sp. GSS18]